MSQALTAIPFDQAQDAARWDGFLRQAGSPSILLERGYLAYHADRFPDASALLMQGKKLVGLFPATKAGDQLSSHAGLSYGGLLMLPDAPLKLHALAWDALLDFYGQQGFQSLIYAPLPELYHPGKDAWVMPQLRAKLLRTEANAVIELHAHRPWQYRRVRALHKAQKARLSVGLYSDALPEFWALLRANLAQRHGLTPVHSLAEMQQLCHTFPRQIALHVARQGEHLLAGVLAYEHQKVIHLQYIAAALEGRRKGALEAIIYQICGHYRQIGKNAISLGVSTLRADQAINSGLLEWKEGFGIRHYWQHAYRLSLHQNTRLAERFRYAALPTTPHS